MSSEEKKQDSVEEKKQVTRREFVKGAAVMGAAAASAGVLAACAPAPSAPAATSAPAASAPGATAALPQKWDKETDVVVVGTGIAGLPAAIEAKNAGADVIVLEKNTRPGGLAFHSGGHFILGNTRIIREDGLQDSAEAWAEDELKTGDYRGVPEVIKAYSTEGDNTITFYEKLGIVWQGKGRANSSPGHRINRSHFALAQPGKYPGGFPASGGVGFIAVLLKEVSRLGISILLQHRMTRIYRSDPTGPVVGVEVSTPTGTINIKARKGVVLASGGWVDNAQLCKAWDPRIVDSPAGTGDFYPDMWPYHNYSMGDGLLAAQAIGAGFTDMSFVSYIYIRCGTKQYALWEPQNDQTATGSGSGIEAFMAKAWQRTIFVKNDGKRFVNEQLGESDSATLVGGKDVNYERSQFVLAYIDLQDRPRNAWAITDADGAVAIKWPVDKMKNPNPKEVPALYPDMVAIADTLQELAGKMKMPADALQATVDKYNGFVDAGKDADFGKLMPFNKISKPPFYAAKAMGLRHTQRNGLRINSKAQVVQCSDCWDGAEPRSIDQEKVIPHLYAAGEVAGFLGWRRPHGTLGPYTIMGRFAGKNAAAEKSWG